MTTTTNEIEILIDTPNGDVIEYGAGDDAETVETAAEAEAAHRGLEISP